MPLRAQSAQRAGRFVGVPEQLAEGAGRSLNLIERHVLAFEAEPRDPTQAGAFVAGFVVA